MASSEHVYVSITGLQLKRLWHAPRFWSLSVPAMVQAQSAPGNLGAATQTIEGVHHTRSVWVNREAALAYAHSGAHAKAMAAFDDMATGVVFGFETHRDAIPDWPELHAQWRERQNAASASR